MKTNFILYHYYLFSVIDLIYLDFFSLGEYIFYLGMILLAGRALKEILGISAKATGVVASAIFIADKFTGGGSSSTPEDKDKIIKIKKILQRKIVKMITMTEMIKKLLRSKSLLLRSRLRLRSIVKFNQIDKFRYSFILPLIFSKLDIDVSNIKVNDLSYAILILSIIALYSFINIIGYMLSYILIQNINYKTFEEKYPWLKKFISYFKKSSLFFIILEVLVIIICLLILILSSLCFIYLGIKL